MSDSAKDAAPLLVQRPSPHVTLMVLNRPTAMNALNEPLLDALARELLRADADQEVRCVVVTGAGRAFSAGGDIKAMRRMSTQQRAAYLKRFGELATCVHELGVPVIAAVNGYALAGGFELAALCDIRLVADDAELGVVDASIGLSPTSGLTWTLPRIVGLGNALYLVLASPRLDAGRAHALGFAQEVVAHDHLRTRALELAAAMASHPVLGMRLSKHALTRAAVSTLAEATRREHADELRCFEDEAVLRAFAAFGAPETVTDPAPGKPA